MGSKPEIRHSSYRDTGNLAVGETRDALADRSTNTPCHGQEVAVGCPRSRVFRAGLIA